MIKMAQLIARFKRNDFARDSLLLMLGTVAAQLVTVVSIPILSRLYNPAAFGVLAVFTAVSSVVAIVVTLRYEAAILLPKKNEAALSLLSLSLCLVLALGGLLVLLAFIVPDNWVAALGISVLGEWLPVAVLTGMGLAVFAVVTVWLSRVRAYADMAKLRFAQSLLAASCAVSFGVYGMTDGLLIAQLVSVSGLVLLVMSRLPENCIHSRAAMQEAGGKYRSAPAYLLPTALLDTLTLQLPVLLIVAWYDSQVAGQFGMAWKILALPISLVGAAVGQVFLQRFSTFWPDAYSARRLLVRTWLLLAFVGLIPTTLLMLVGEELFVWGLGASWAHSGRMAEILAPMLFVMLISSPTSGTFLVLGLQRYSLLFGILVLLYRPACLAVGFVTGYLEHGLLALVIAEVAQVFLYQLLAYRKIGSRL